MPSPTPSSVNSTTTAALCRISVAGRRSQTWQPRQERDPVATKSTTPITPSSFPPFLRPRSLHDMRHTTASILINQGLHPKIVQEHLGHGSISITVDRYGHLYDTDTQRLAAALGAAYTTGLVAPEAVESIRVADNTRTTSVSASTSDQAQEAKH